MSGQTERQIRQKPVRENYETLMERENRHFDELPCGLDDLQFTHLEAELSAKLGITALSGDLLRALGLAGRDGKFTNAGALLADTNRFYGTDIAKFGDSLSVILDREIIAGVSVLTQFEDAVRAYRRYYQYEAIRGFERVTVEKIPETAFREAAANALVHRVWDINSHVRIAMFPDRIEIISPGDLPEGMTQEMYLNCSVSCLRNPILSWVFCRLLGTGMSGTGIRKIRGAYANAPRPLQPVFAARDNAVCVILPCTDRKISVTAGQAKILKALNSGIPMTRREISDLTGWSKDKAVRVLDSLLRERHIQKIGSGRGTRYAKP